LKDLNFLPANDLIRWIPAICTVPSPYLALAWPVNQRFRKETMENQRHGHCAQFDPRCGSWLDGDRKLERRRFQYLHDSE